MAREKKRRRRFALVTVAGLALAAIVLLGAATVRPDAGAVNFSQVPGFAKYFVLNPPSDDVPGLADRELLERHRPRFHLPPGHAGLISFYDDYVAQGTLYDGEGKVISSDVDRALLNAHGEDPHVTFVHEPDPAQPARPVVFARIDRDTVDLGTHGQRDFTFLTYHAVFRHSGLAEGVAGWQDTLASVFADTDDWHQLDHYTSASLVLDEDMTPLALLVQQHNGRRTYLLGDDYELPEDGRPALDVAVRSNELYPHADGMRTYKVVRFPGRDEMKYLLGLAERPWLAAEDVTRGGEEAGYELRFLPQTDAFYTFEGYLGERRVLPGRSGPPGADYNTWPTFKPWGLQLMRGYWRTGHKGDQERYLQALKSDDWAMAMIRQQREIFGANLVCIRQGRTGCTLQ